MKKTQGRVLVLINSTQLPIDSPLATQSITRGEYPKERLPASEITKGLNQRDNQLMEGLLGSGLQGLPPLLP